MDELEALDLGPDNEQQLARLRRALSLGDGFQLVLVEISHPRLAREILRRLRQWSGHDGVPALAIVRTRPGRDPIAPLRGLTGGAVLIGIDEPFEGADLERALVTVDDGGPEAGAGAPAGDPVEVTMTTLNWFRDELPELVKGPLVLVLSPDGLRRLFVLAPDLLAWRAHTTRVSMTRWTELEVRYRPGRRASLEEKAWLEQMSAAGAGGAHARELPGWLIRLGEIEAREGGPWEQRLARAAELAAGQRDVLFRIELARARHALDEARDEDAGAHIYRAAGHIAVNTDDPERDPEAMLETMGWGAAAREQWTRIATNQLSLLVAEQALHAGEVEAATTMAESALLGARTYGDSALVIAALGVAGAVALQHADRIMALARFGEMRKLARDVQDRAAESFALTRIALLAPELADARRLYGEAVSLLEHDDHETRARACLVLVARELPGNPDQAERNLSQIPVEELEPRTRIRVLAARGALARMRRRHDDALAAYRSAWDAPQRRLFPSRSQAVIGMGLADSALIAGDADTARDAYRCVAEIAQVLADPQLEAAARSGLARASAEPAAPGTTAHPADPADPEPGGGRLP